MILRIIAKRLMLRDATILFMGPKVYLQPDDFERFSQEWGPEKRLGHMSAWLFEP
jgi:hypothetical protein